MMVARFCACIALLLVVSGTDQPPTISGPESDTAVKTNGTATLRCTVNTALKPEWHTGSPFSSLSPTSISSDEHYKLNESQTSLVVTGFRNRHHGGEYTCKFQSKPFTQVLLSCPGKLSHAKIDYRFLTEPYNLTAGVGTMAVLKCSPPESNPAASVSWKKGQVFSDPDPSSTLQARSGNLYFLNVTEKDEGYYQCWATNTVTNRIRHSFKVYLNVQVTDLTSLSPEFIVTPANVTARLGETAEFECAINTGAQVQWEWVGHASLPLSVIQENGALLLVQVGEEQNGGVFRCRAGEMVAEAHLSVVAPPTVILSTSTLSGPPGSTVSLSCAPTLFALSGEVEVVWQIGGIILKSETVSGVPSYLNYSLPSEGVSWIQCLLRNQYGCDHESVSLAVSLPEPVTPAPSEVRLVVSPDVTLSPGSVKFLTCEVIVPNGAMVVSLGWEPSTDVIEISRTSTSVVVSVYTPGTYTCLSTVFIWLIPHYPSAAVVVSADQPNPATTVVHSSTSKLPMAANTSSLQSTTTSSIPVAVSTASPSPSSEPVSTPPSEASIVVSPNVNLSPGSVHNLTCVVSLPSGAFVDFIKWDSSMNYSIVSETTTTYQHTITISVSSPDNYTCVSLVFVGIQPQLLSAVVVVSTDQPGSVTTTAHSSTSQYIMATSVFPPQSTTTSSSAGVTLSSGASPSPSSPPEVRVVVSPDAVLNPGDVHTLSCVVNVPPGTPVISIYWDLSQPQTKISENNGQTQSTLKILAGAPGTYTYACVSVVGIIPPFELYNAVITVTVVDPDPVTSTTTVKSTAVTTVNSIASPSPSAEPVRVPQITSVTPSGGVKEAEGEQVSVMCVAIHTTSIVWSHTTILDISSDSMVISGVDGQNFVSTIILNPLLAKHQGTLTCTAVGSNNDTDHRDFPIVVKASRPLVSPGSLQTFWHDDNLFVTWADPEEINIPLMGYKLTWGPVGTPLSQTALRAVPFGTNIYMISGLDSEKDYLVLVWCYSNGGDGPASSIRTTESTTTPTPPLPTDDTEGTPSSPAPSVSLRQCISLLHNVGSVTIEAEQTTPIHHYLIYYSCLDDSRMINTTSLGHFLLSGLLPGCQYQVIAFAVDGNGKNIAQSSCELTTFSVEVPVKFSINWTNPNELSVTWELPSSLKTHQNVIFQVKINGEWIELVNGAQTFETFDQKQDNFLEVRALIDGHVIYTETILVPAQLLSSVQPSPSPGFAEGKKDENLWFYYGLGIGGIFLSTLLALSLVLLICFIQNKKRKDCKNIKQNRKRMSQSSQKALFSREDSVQSIKKPYSPSMGVNNIYSET